MRSTIIVAIALIVVCVAIGLWLLHGYSVPQTMTKTLCEVVEVKPVVKKVLVNNVTWIEIVEGKRIVKRCRLVELVKKHLCVVDSYGYRCFDEWEPKRVLKVWNQTSVERQSPRIYIRVDLAAYEKLWIEENRALIDRFSYKPKFRLVTVTRPLLLDKYITLEVPVPEGFELADKPTYIRWVLGPALVEVFRMLSIDTKPEIAKAIKTFVESVGYNNTQMTTNIELTVVYGGVCGSWAYLGYTLATYFNLSVALINGIVPGTGYIGGLHASAFLCEPWWRNSYGAKLYLKNGTAIECYIWIDTGYAIENWDRYRLIDLWIAKIDGKTIKRNSIIKIEKIS